MLSFSEHLIDKELCQLDEELQEGLIKSLLSKLDDKKKKEIEGHVAKVKSEKDPKVLKTYAKHPHFAVRLAVARNKNTHPDDLKSFKSAPSEYKSVMSAAENTLKSLSAA